MPAGPAADALAAREALTRALAAFANTPLREAAEGLFGALGYRSERTVDAGGAAGFIGWLDANRPLTGARRALFEDWRAAEIVFQVTGEEISGASGPLDSAFDRGRIESFLFAAAELAGGAYTRTHLAETARAVNACLPMPVVLLFRHGEALTLAVVHRRAHKRDGDRDVLEKVTLIKDIRLANPHRAHLESLADLALPRLAAVEGVRDFDGLHAAWERALDTETLNRRFYRELFAWFERAVAECRFPDDGAGAGSAERHAIRLITRLLFVWFLVEKGLVPRTLFDADFARRALGTRDPASTDYYRAILQNLFFATLNTEIDKRAFSGKNNRSHRDSRFWRYRDRLADPDGFVECMRRVPFINGGLFDCLDDFAGAGEGGRRIDAFTDNERAGRDLRVPERLFLDEDGLFPLFRRYKFTVEENTPLDREVALDPELLGRAFENLLAAYNPETRETARKATGSYYTPRHIVDYMVGEALVAALAEKAPPADGDGAFWRERLRYLFDYEDAFDDAAELFERTEAEAVVRAIAGLRILDPAVGSGAFPMGALHRLTLALRRLDGDNALWEGVQKELAAGRAGAAFEVREDSARDKELLEISRLFEVYRESDYGRKLFLIQNGLFGVDIQPIACQIAKLRFFISLAIEQRTGDDPANNYGIRPLPNLETRFVAADTLVGPGAAGAQGVLGDSDVRALQDELRRARERYFNARGREEKRELRKKDRTLRTELARALEGLGYGHDSAEAVAAWDPYDHNARAGWFDPEWMFGASGGFDVAIGNPPYVRGEKIPGKARLREAFGEFFRATADIYTYFFMKSVDMLRDSGVLCFIASNKFMRAGYGEPLRAFLAERAPPLSILDFGRTGTFDATVRPLTLLARKGGDRETLRAATVRGAGGGAANPGAFMKAHGFALPVASLSARGWTLAEPALLRLRDKIEKAGTPLRDYAKDGILYGVKTGFNKAFVIDAETRDRLIDDDPGSEKLIEPWLRGRDVRRYKMNWEGLYVIFTQGIDITRYPAVESHLAQFYNNLKPKKVRGPGPGRAPGNYKWFEFQATIAYHEAFYRPKIVYPIIATEMRATLDRDGHLTNDKCFIIPGNDGFLLSILNSRALDLWFRLAMPCLDDPFDGGDMEFRGVVMARAPIASAPPAVARRLATLANRVQAARHAHPTANTESWEAQIDKAVFKIYGLDKREIAIIENLRRRDA